MGLFGKSNDAAFREAEDRLANLEGHAAARERDTGELWKAVEKLGGEVKEINTMLLDIEVALGINKKGSRHLVATIGNSSTIK